jgi:hypothetical protein
MPYDAATTTEPVRDRSRLTANRLGWLAWGLQGIVLVCLVALVWGDPDPEHVRLLAAVAMSSVVARLALALISSLLVGRRGR